MKNIGIFHKKKFFFLCLCFLFFINIIAIGYADDEYYTYKNDRYYIDANKISSSSDMDSEEIITMDSSFLIRFYWSIEDIIEIEKIKFKLSIDTNYCPITKTHYYIDDIYNHTITIRNVVSIKIQIYDPDRNSKRKTLVDFIFNHNENSTSLININERFTKSFNYDNIKGYIKKTDEHRNLYFKVSMSINTTMYNPEYTIESTELILIPPETKPVNPVDFIIAVFIWFTVIISILVFVFWFAFHEDSNKKTVKQFSKPIVKLIQKPITVYNFNDIKISECKCGWKSKEIVNYCEKCGKEIK